MLNLNMILFSLELGLIEESVPPAAEMMEDYFRRLSAIKETK